MTGEWIGFASVIGPVILLAIFFWLRFKGRRDMQETIRAALDKGQVWGPLHGVPMTIKESYQVAGSPTTRRS